MSSLASRKTALKKKQSVRRTRPHRLTAPIAAIRGFIPASVRAGDSPFEIADLYQVCVGTARIWLRILRGTKYNY